MPNWETAYNAEILTINYTLYVNKELWSPNFTAGKLKGPNSFRLTWRILTTPSSQVHVTLVKCCNSLSGKLCSPNFGSKIGYQNQLISDLFKWYWRRYNCNMTWFRVKAVSLCQQEWLLPKLERPKIQLIVLYS